jgi:hypothetical protein
MQKPQIALYEERMKTSKEDHRRFQAVNEKS